MKQRILSIALLLCRCLSGFAQAKSLVVDCQTPGWLSSMINYGDQQTVENITVTGYINDADLTFLGSLSKNQRLNGIINLEDVQIVGDTPEDNNMITKGYFGGHIIHLILPKSLVSATTCLSGASFDTVTIGGEALPIIKNDMFYKATYSGGDGVRLNKNVKNIVLRDGVTTISRRAFYNKLYNSYGVDPEDCVFESITIPSSVTAIEESAFSGCFALRTAKWSDNLESIGHYAFMNTKLYEHNDTIVLPNNLKLFYFDSFSNQDPGFLSSTSDRTVAAYIGQHIYVPKSVESLSARYICGFGSNGTAHEDGKCYLHMASENPPKLEGMIAYLYARIIVYVPKNSVEVYQSNSYWKDATILAEPNPAKSIDIQQELIEIKKGNSSQLSAIVLPMDADDVGFTWSSSNSEVVSVSSNGLITGHTSGEAKIYATLNTDKRIIDSCFVKVFQPVTGISLNISSKSVKVGEMFSLEATIIPFDADNKNIEWSSDDCELASVENGKVTALKPGVVKIFATSEYDNQVSAFCEVTISQPVTGITLDPSEMTIKGIGKSVQLVAHVLPEDASNKDVVWLCPTPAVCVVSNGTVVSTGFGTAVVIATTVDGGLMATCLITVEEEEKPIAVGDVNGDGEVNATDLACIVNVLAGLESNETYEGRADVNADGQVTASDIAEVVNILAGLS